MFNFHKLGCIQRRFFFFFNDGKIRKPQILLYFNFSNANMIENTRTSFSNGSDDFFCCIKIYNSFWVGSPCVYKVGRGNKRILFIVSFIRTTVLIMNELNESCTLRAGTKIINDSCTIQNRSGTNNRYMLL